MNKLMSSVAVVAALAMLATACAKNGSSPNAPVDAANDGAVVVPTPCTASFRYVPPPGTTATAVSVSGEWNSFANPGVVMTQDATGAFDATVTLSPGLVGYKQLIVDNNWILDPSAHLQKYVGGVANTAVDVPGCALPTLSVATNGVTRAAAGQGHYTATIAFAHGAGAPGLDATSATATIRKDGVTSSVANVTADASAETIAIDAAGLADG